MTPYNLVLVSVTVLMFHHVQGGSPRSPNMRETLIERLLKRWVNDYDKEFTFTCPDGEVMTGLRSIHDNYYEDRKWDFTCKALPGVALENCKMPDEKSFFSQGTSINPVTAFTCPDNGLFTGVWSKHFDWKEDRLYDFRCCTPKEARLSGCQWTGYQNEYDGKLDYKVPEGYAIRGIQHQAHFYYDDRRFDFDVCKIEK